MTLEMNSDSNTVVTANGLLRTFLFILSFVVTMNAMAIIKPVSVKLQYNSSDIVYAYSKVKNVTTELSRVRGNDQILHAWYIQAESLALEVDVTPQVPRIAGRQCHRDNVEHILWKITTVEQ